MPAVRPVKVESGCMSTALIPSHDPRFVPLAGTLNTRDLGGLPVAGGGTTRSGVFYRSDIPMALGAADIQQLKRLGLSTVVDLRQPYELERDPNSLASEGGIDYRNVEIWGRIDDAQDQPADPFDITAFYLRALDHAGEAFVQVLTVLADAPGAALFHCTAGKDRTGLVAALLLESVGVERDVIVDDFALTHDRIGPLRERLLADAEKQGVKREDFARLLGATPDLLGPALEHLSEHHGGAVTYLERHGLAPATLDTLRRKLAG